MGCRNNDNGFIGGYERKERRMQNRDCQKLRNCPFCGGEGYDLQYGEVERPDGYFESGLRGEKYGFVMCRCGCVIKADTLDEAIEAWNRRVNNG